MIVNFLFEDRYCAEDLSSTPPSSILAMIAPINIVTFIKGIARNLSLRFCTQGCLFFMLWVKIIVRY